MFFWNLESHLMNSPYETKRRIAFHEAGHAYMLWSEGLGISFLTLDPSRSEPGDTRGLTQPGANLQVGQPLLSEKFARSAIAGSAAEHFLTGSWDGQILEARAYDIGRAKSYLVLGGGDWRQDALDFKVQTILNNVLDEIARPRTWDVITALAFHLMGRGALMGEEASEVLGE